MLKPGPTLQTENVWDYPRPPRLEPVPHEVRIALGGRTIAATRAAWRVLETSHPPTYYLPGDAFTGCAIETAGGASFCEWKGRASYWTLRAGERVAGRAGWSYEDPAEPFAAIAGHLAVHCAMTDGCFVAGSRVEPQPGGFYGGWITPNLRGPFKGAPGTMGW